MTDNPLDLIEARAQAATNGPWEAVDAFDENGEDWLYSEIKHTYRADGIVWPNQILGTVDLDEADAVFIAHAREDVPLLAGIVRTVKDLHWRQFYANKPSTCHADGKHWPCPTITAIREALHG